MRGLSDFFKTRYFGFIAIITSITIISSLILHWNLNQRNHEAKLLRLAGKQSLLCQQLVKTTLFIERKLESNLPTDTDIDSLKFVVKELRTVHNALLEIPKNRSIDSALNKFTPLLERSLTAADMVIDKPAPVVFQQASLLILNNDYTLAHASNLLSVYVQRDTEQKHAKIKQLDIVTSAIIFFIIIFGIIFLLRPYVQKLEKNNVELSTLNGLLSVSHQNIKATNEKLEHSERLYRLISNNSKDLILQYDLTRPDPVRRFVSPSVKDILGYAPEDLLGKASFDFVLPEDMDRVKNAVQIVNSKAQSAHTEYRARKKDGTIIWMDSSLHPFFNDRGEIMGFQTSDRDITRRKEIEASLRKEKERAEDASQAKSQFLSMMSHEIRTPMNAVVGLTNFLLDERPREDQAHHLRLLKHSGENLLTIINDILDFSKIEAGKISLECIPIKLHNVVSEVIDAFKARAFERKILLSFNYDPSLPEVVLGDPVRIEQIIMNLIGNAIKFTKKGLVELKVSQAGRKGHDWLINFQVIDTGIGIEKEKQASVFESFSQASEDTTRKFGGTGLGLSITRRLLHLMGSEIHLTSEINRGSEFSFVLKMAEGELSINRQQHFPVITRNSTIHVLLAEDNEVNQLVASNFITKWGYEVTIANNGAEALEYLKEKTFHIILLDLQMPEIDGYEVMKRIRAIDDSYYQKLPIIALTASAMRDVESKLLRMGMTDYISKPFKPDMLHEKILKHALVSVPNNKDHSLKRVLDDYAGGDQDISVDLAHKMVKNIDELQYNLMLALAHNDPATFARICHKMKTTIGILKNNSLAKCMDDVMQSILLRKDLVEQLALKVDVFNKECERSIAELSKLERKGFSEYLKSG